MSGPASLWGQRFIERRAPLRADLPPSLHPVLRAVYAARHVRSADELDYSLERLLPPWGLRGIDRAVELLADALRRGARLLIIADFDADGATSCAVALRCLREMGARDVRYLVPNRFAYGYGLTPEIVAAASAMAPDLIITVDNGMSSVEGVAAAHARGIPVLITDHHLPGVALPSAAAVVNPNQSQDTFPSKHLAGVGVIFYVMLALRAQLRRHGWFGRGGPAEPNLARHLDLVALGTVADLVTLDHNNRILVGQGLRRINRGECAAGILALLTVAGRRPGELGAADLGFAVAPRVNAAGRLSDMSLGIECLTTDDPARAMTLARELDRLNGQRRALESQMNRQASEALSCLHLESAALPAGLCLFDDSWHQGVIGLVASRAKEQTHRPVIAFAPAGEGTLKGSARSVPGLHIRDVLDAVAARHPALLRKFGGHAMAAGLSLDRGDLEAFRAAFDEEVRRSLPPEALARRILSDGELAAGDLAVELALVLRAAGPWGQGFPEPVFDGDFDLVGQRVVGDNHLALRLRVAGADETVAAIVFNARAGRIPAEAPLRVAYRLGVNDYQGRRTLQLVIEHLQPAGARVDLSRGAG